jgi:MFS family permease
MHGQSSETAMFGPRFWVLIAGVPLVAVDVSIMDVLLPDIVRKLNISVADASLVDAVTVTIAGALTVSAGKLGDMFGAKRLLLAGLIVLIGGSLATGLANGLGTLITGRIAQGVAFAMVLTMVIAMLNRDYPQGPARARAFALYFALAVAALGLAPLIGALLKEYASWRWAFLGNAPLAAAVAIGSYRLRPKEPAIGSTRSFDALGSLLLIVALGLILFGIQQGSRYGWVRSREGIELFGRAWTPALSPTPVIIGLGVVLITAFMLLEGRRSKKQLDVVLDTRLFHIRSFVWGTLALALAASASMGALLAVSLYAEYILGAGAVTAGLMVAPMGMAVIVTGFVRARLDRFSTRTIGMISVGVQMITIFILIAAFSVKGLPLAIVAAMFLLGVFMISGLSAMTSQVLADVPAKLSGEAAGVQTSARFLICGFAMVVVTVLLISVTAFQVQKVSLTGLSAPDRASLDAVERLTRPAVSERLVDTGTAAQRKEVERYNETLELVRKALDEGIRTAAIAIVLMLAIGLFAATRLPAQPAQILNKE